MSVKCLSISHKIRKRIESLDKGMLNAQKMFECAINKHKFDSIWILRPLQRQRWPFKENLISRGASFIAPSSRNVVSSEHNQSAGDTDGPGPGARGVMVKYDTLPGHFIHCGHHISVFGFNNDSILSLYTCRNSHSTIYLIVHRLHATDGVREYIWRNLIKIVHVHLMIYYLMFYYLQFTTKIRASS